MLYGHNVAIYTYTSTFIHYLEDDYIIKYVTLSIYDPLIGPIRLGIVVNLNSDNHSNQDFFVVHFFCNTFLFILKCFIIFYLPVHYTWCVSSDRVNLFSTRSSVNEPEIVCLLLTEHDRSICLSRFTRVVQMQ